MSAPAACPARGVYFARHRKDGRLIVYAVDSTGNELRPRLILRDESQQRIDAAAEYLWNRLDLEDPVGSTRLSLVRDVPTLELLRRATSAELDPYNMPPLPFRRAR